MAHILAFYDNDHINILYYLVRGEINLFYFILFIYLFNYYSGEQAFWLLHGFTS